MKRSGRLGWTAILLFVLAACGGGGGGGSGGIQPPPPPPTQPYILAAVLIFPTGAVPPGLVPDSFNTIAAVTVTNGLHGTSITNATVTVDGVTLTYDSTTNQYAAALNVSPNATVTLTVVVNGSTYTKSHTNFSTYPTITAPAANETWSLHAGNLISWSGAVPDSSSSYALGVFATTGGLVYPTNGAVQVLSTSQTDEVLPTDTLTAGSRLVLVGIIDDVTLPGAASGSSVIIGEFNYVPITITASTAVLQSIATSPAKVGVSPGKTVQLVATGVYSDGTSQDVTAQASWSSADTTIATVNGTGLVSGVARGAVHVIANLGGFSANSLVTVFAPNPSPAPPLSESYAYQIDYAHSGRATVGVSGPTFPPISHWSATLKGLISYPLIANGMVFVTTNALPSSGNSGTSLYALDKASGNIVWGPTGIPESFSLWSGLAYDHGTVFVINYDGKLASFNAATGAPGWSISLPGQDQIDAPPMAVNGIVYVGGNALLTAVDELTGSVLWIAPVMGGDQSSPAASSDGVFVAYPCQVYKFDPIAGTPLWHFNGGCEGGGGATTAYANNLLYARDVVSSGPQPIFNAKTGTKAGNFAAGPIPAFSATVGYFQADGTLSAIDQTSHTTLWTFTGDGKLVSAPIVVDGAVIIGSSSGTVYALNATTGATLWSASAGAAINGPDEQNIGQPLTGFGVGDGYLIVPGSNVLNGWQLVP
jgi:outer membrane protein assembly factor BamB